MSGLASYDEKLQGAKEYKRLASFVDGYRGPRRGVLEYDLSAFGAGMLGFVPNKLKPRLAPYILSVRPRSERGR